MIKVLRQGFYTTVQDLGRFGFRNQGIPTSGGMDLISANLANSLLGNSMSNAFLEMTLNGPKLLFSVNTCIAITGANMSPKINDEPIDNNKQYAILKGDILSFGELINGTRCYLAVKRGIDSEIVLKSRSQFHNITTNNKLIKNDLLKIYATSNEIKTLLSKDQNKQPFFKTDVIEVLPGPEFKLFTKNEMDKILNQKFTISNENNRMGYQMDEKIVSHNISITTSPVIPGTVQLLPSGKIVILMKDAQTTGGYPRIFQLTSYSIAVLAQKQAKDTIHLKLKM